MHSLDSPDVKQHLIPCIDHQRLSGHCCNYWYGLSDGKWCIQGSMDFIQWNSALNVEYTPKQLMRTFTWLTQVWLRFICRIGLWIYFWILFVLETQVWFCAQNSCTACHFLSKILDLHCMAYFVTLLMPIIMQVILSELDCGIDLNVTIIIYIK